MPARKANATAIPPVTYAGASVRLYPRKDGRIYLRWHENGQEQNTTKPDLDSATDFARKKVRLIATGQGQRLISPGDAHHLDTLTRLAGGPDKAAAFLGTVETALNTLGNAPHLLLEAATWYAKQGLASTAATTVRDAATAFLAELKADHPLSTASPIRSTIKALIAAHGDLPLLELDEPLLTPFVRRPTDRTEKPSKRTIRNRIDHLTTFLNRAIDKGWWPPDRKVPSLSIKRPRTDDTAPEILLPHQGKAVFLTIRRHKPLALPYLIIAGWLGCRPSECLRLDWSDFDWQNKLLHIRVEVAGKTNRERWVPLKKEVIALLRPLAKETGRVCRPRSREMITTLIAERKLLPEWHPDVLRHSYITYRLNEGGTHEEVAEESGNSPAIIRSNYRRPVPPGLGKQWFAILKAPA